MSFYTSILAPIIFKLNAETAHGAAIKTLRYGLVPSSSTITHASLEQTLFGLTFKNPVGLAAGFDKNAEVWQQTLKQGFGFVEIGTVTPRPQIGNPKPRLFRLKEDQAVINRMGFNNHGMDATYKNLATHRAGQGIVGVNIGKNKDTENAAEDYTALVRRFADVADYFTVNISSPNTEGLRALQDRDALMILMKAIMKERNTQDRRVPMLIKIAPDLDDGALTDGALTDIASVALMLDCDGIIVSNTTIARPETLRSKHKNETGGLSGVPLFTRSNEVLASLYRITQGRIPLIGVGGITSAEDAITKIRSGASLIQLYSALVYQGFGLVHTINKGIIAHLKAHNMLSINELIGKDIA